MMELIALLGGYLIGGAIYDLWVNGPKAETVAVGFVGFVLAVWSLGVWG